LAPNEGFNLELNEDFNLELNEVDNNL
jgi:hypothetical protein